jgi:hypothetical protein
VSECVRERQRTARLGFKNVKYGMKTVKKKKKKKVNSLPNGSTRTTLSSPTQTESGVKSIDKRIRITDGTFLRLLLACL